jgi:hypothetical protein
MSKLTKDDWVALKFSLKKNSKNRYLSPMECAELLLKAKQIHTMDEILKKIDLSKSMFDTIVRLDQIKPKRIRKSVIWGHSEYHLGLINMSISAYIAQLKNEKGQLKLYELVCKHQLIKDEIKDVIPEFNRGKSIYDVVDNIVSLRVKTIKKNQIIGKVMNEKLSEILVKEDPKTRNLIFKEYLCSIIDPSSLNQCVLNERRFFIDCTVEAADIIQNLSKDLESYISEELLKIVFSD